MGAKEDLNKLRATLEGLAADGTPAEALAPLEKQISALEKRVAEEDAPPPQSEQQQPSAAKGERPSVAKAELDKLRATLEGLAADGFPAEALAPLETQIAALEKRVAKEDALPPLSEQQRRIWELCDKVEDEELRSTDEDAPKRAAILRSERTYLLDGLVRADLAEYMQCARAWRGPDPPAASWRIPHLLCWPHPLYLYSCRACVSLPLPLVPQCCRF